MNFLRKWIRILLGFSARETSGFLILLPLITLIVFSEPVYRLIIVHRDEDFSSDRKKLDSLVAIWDTDLKSESKSSDSLQVGKKSAIRRTPTRFNPNTTSVQQLINLGFPEILAKRTASYRQKGGQFRFKTDLLKIYGIDSPFYKSIAGYILLPDKVSNDEKKQQLKQAVQSQKPRFVSFDLNHADTIELKSVYGIGTKLAGRIIKFRNALGGFVRMDQLHEVFGLDSAVCQRLKESSMIDENFSPTKIDLNTANERALSHPYLNRNLAKAIVAWRFQHGKFTNINQIRDLHLLSEDAINKLLPYLKVDE